MTYAGRQESSRNGDVYTHTHIHTSNHGCGLPSIHEFHPHQFRANTIRIFEKQGKGLEVGSKFLGHKNVTTTYRRYHHVDTEALALTMPLFLPREPAGTVQEKPDVESLGTSAILKDEIERRRELETEVARMKRELEFWRVRATPVDLQECTKELAGEAVLYGDDQSDAPSNGSEIEDPFTTMDN